MITNVFIRHKKYGYSSPLVPNWRRNFLLTLIHIFHTFWSTKCCSCMTMSCVYTPSSIVCMFAYATHPSKTIRVPGNIHLRMSCRNAPLTRRHGGIYTINGCTLPPIMSYMCFKCIITTCEIIWFCFISHILWRIITDAKIGHYLK